MAVLVCISRVAIDAQNDRTKPRSGTTAKKCPRSRRRFAALVDALPQFLARFEVWNVLAGQRHRGAGLGIAAGARRAVVQRKTAEAADFDAIAARQCCAHLLDHVAHRQLDISKRQMLLAFRERGDQFGFRHGWQRAMTLKADPRGDACAPLSTAPPTFVAAPSCRRKHKPLYRLTPTCSTVLSEARPAWSYRVRHAGSDTRTGFRPSRPHPWRGSRAAACGPCDPCR